ncbi:MAG: universal stress protein [Hyphomicrobiales bacterium]|nr:MAG: universal stress protein [Hyphomicrobiales bacterium]
MSIPPPDLPPLDVDVRPILRDGGEPFGAIMEAVARLAPGQSLRLYATFKPVPLFGVLGARGFEPSAREIGGGDWEVLFSPRAAAPQPDRPATAAPAAGNGNGGGDDWPEPSIEIDNRDLDPPEPMVRTLEVLEKLMPGEALAAILPREPIFLLKELESRGHRWRGATEPDGSYRIVIRAGDGRAAAS